MFSFSVIQEQSEEATAKYKLEFKIPNCLKFKLLDALLRQMEQAEKEAIEAASREISREFNTLTNADDVDSLKQLQHLILGRLQDSNAVLSHYNEYSEHCFAEVSGDFAKNTRLLKSMKADLDYVFQKLRNMKSKILATYPDAFPDEAAIEALDRRPDLETPQ